MPSSSESPAPTSPASIILEAGTVALDRFKRDLNLLRLIERKIPGTLILSGGLTIIFVLGLALDVLFVQGQLDIQDSIDPMIVLGAKINSEIQSGAIWRLVSHTFVHSTILHLFFNVYGLYLLGSLVERLFGTRRFIAIYGFSALGGALATYLFNDMASVGASGAIFGVLGAAIVFGHRHKHLIPPKAAKGLSRDLVPWLLLSLAIGLTPLPIDNAAHLGGLVVGIATAWWLDTPLSGLKHPTSKRVWGGVLVSLIVLSVLSLLMMGWQGIGCFDTAESWNQCQETLKN